MKSPDKISGLVFWLDAADTTTVNNGIITDGAFVNTFRDKSGGYTLTSPQSLGVFIAGAGPTYSFGRINGKNAICFSHFTSATSTNNTSFRRLAVANCTPLGIAENTTFVVCYPSDVRLQVADTSGTVESRQMIATVYAATRVTSLPSGTLYPDKQWFVNTYRNTNLGTGRNTGTGYIDAVAPYNQTALPATTGLRTYLYDQVQDMDKTKINLTSGPFYAYGKVNIFSTRYKDDLKKFTIIRPGFHSSESFQPRYGRYTNLAATVTNPVLTIGAGWPGYGLAGSVNTQREFAQSQPFEGFFCEMLVFNRVLSHSETNAVEEYLKSKWIN
jgi:hypothetical protein